MAHSVKTMLIVARHDGLHVFTFLPPQYSIRLLRLALRFRHFASLTFAYLRPRHTGLTTKLRPSCDRIVLEAWANRRKNVRLVAEVVVDRQGKISGSKIDGHVQNI